ncbi:hypothetical protein ABES02_20875 [Neobacillus pocheonensis]
MKNKETNVYVKNEKTKGVRIISRRSQTMAKRKAEFDAVEKYTKTPHKNVQESEFSAEFTDNNNAIRFQNRNSKLGKKGRS